MQLLDDQDILAQIKSEDPQKFIVLIVGCKQVDSSVDPQDPSDYRLTSTLETIYFDNEKALTEWAVKHYNPETMAAYRLNPIELTAEKTLKIQSSPF